MAAKKPTGGKAMTTRQKIAAQKRSQPKPQSLKTKVENKVKEVKSTYDKVSKTPGIAVKGGPRTRPARMAQPAKPKTGTTKSRGSNTKKQIGDQNQREWYNGIRQKAGGKIVNTSTDANGQMLKVAQKDKDGRVRASSQRSGGRGK